MGCDAFSYQPESLQIPRVSVVALASSLNDAPKPAAADAVLLLHLLHRHLPSHTASYHRDRADDFHPLPAGAKSNPYAADAEAMVVVAAVPTPVAKDADVVWPLALPSVCHRAYCNRMGPAAFVRSVTGVLAVEPASEGGVVPYLLLPDGQHRAADDDGECCSIC